MPKISNPTKSFMLLFFLAIFGTCLAVMLWVNASNRTISTQETYYSEDNKLPQTQKTEEQKPAEIDTTNWKTYSNNGLSFKYFPEWKIVEPIKKGDYTILQIDPGSKYYNIKIYLSSKDYYVMSGLPSSTETINGITVINVQNLLYGFKKGSTYYTFDIGLSLSLKPYFNALVHSVEIK